MPLFINSCEQFIQNRKNPVFSIIPRQRKFGFRGSIRLAPGRMLFWVPDQNNALRFSGFQPEARLRATLGQDAPHGRGVSDPSPCAPPRQALCASPVGHCVVGFCGSIRLAPDQTDRRRAPSSGLLGWRRSAASAATTPRAASRVRGLRPLPVCPSPASWQAQPVRALWSGVWWLQPFGPRPNG